MFLHHAYLIEGREDAVAAVRLFILEKLGIVLSANTDLFDAAYETFGIDEAREIKEMSSRKPIGERKAILLRVHIFTREAQNALLKIFEDPTPDTHFFVVTPYPRALLPTLLSRMETLAFTSGGVADRTEEDALARRVRAGNIRERLFITEEMLDAEDKMKTIRFLEAFTEMLSKELRDGDTKELHDAFLAATRAASYARDRGASLKTLLEYAVLSLPER